MSQKCYFCDIGPEKQASNKGRIRLISELLRRSNGKEEEIRLMKAMHEESSG